MKVTASELLSRIPGRINEKWPFGERFVAAFAHGSMSVELYAPKEVDPQTPHDQDELYFVNSGIGRLVISGKSYSFEPGACFFVAVGQEHKFEAFSEDFSAWGGVLGSIRRRSAGIENCVAGLSLQVVCKRQRKCLASAA